MVENNLTINGGDEEKWEKFVIAIQKHFVEIIYRFLTSFWFQEEQTPSKVLKISCRIRDLLWFIVP
jgi:hypothetical protein